MPRYGSGSKSGEPGLGQIGSGIDTVSLVEHGPHHGLWGVLPPDTTIPKVKEKIMVGLAKQDPTARASRTGLFEKADFLTLAKKLRRPPRGSAEEREIAQRLEDFAATWAAA